MDVIYGLIPGMILLGLGMVVVFIMAARSGQFDDLDGAAHRILMDDDDNPPANDRDGDREEGRDKRSS
jgi:cbb3-type cytochrome oxidase maturation protein